MFSLTKWYLDLVTDQGTALIVYAATLEWAALRVGYASTFLARPGAQPLEQRAWSHVQMPAIDGETLRFAHDGLGFQGEWTREAPSLDATLLDDSDGRLDWRCFTPSGKATATLVGEPIAGRGYAECITMTRLPWTLPLRRLRWGRYASAAHSAVWIDWSNGAPRRWVWFDGASQPAAILEEDSVSGLESRWGIQLRSVRTLCDRRALEVISVQLRPLADLPIGPLKHMLETKFLKRGTLSHDGVQVDDGWVIDELVAW